MTIQADCSERLLADILQAAGGKSCTSMSLSLGNEERVGALYSDSCCKVFLDRFPGLVIKDHYAVLGRHSFTPYKKNTLASSEDDILDIQSRYLNRP